MRKIYLVCFFAFTTMISGYAQEADNTENQILSEPVTNHYDWQIGVSAFATDHTSVRGVFDGFVDVDDYSVVPFPAKITIVKGINRSFDFDITGNLGEVDNKRIDVNDEFMINGTLGLRYRFANGYIINPDSWFDPYLRLGAGYHQFDYQDLEFTNIVDNSGHTISNGKIATAGHFTVTGGIGMNFWLTEKFGINLASDYYHMPQMEGDNIDFFQHSAGIVFRFGRLDRDGDGIEDKEDECPDTPGLIEFNGCPDTDEDGLRDLDDDCPLEAGPIENVGCPWPDRDGDTVLDKDDKCPDVPGLVELQGCPKPPETPKEPVETPPTPPAPVKIVFDDVLFGFDKFTIQMGEYDSIKDAAKQILEVGGSYYVDGHTDERGSMEYNDTLSTKRAQSVKDALVEEGVDANTLEVRGMGERFPECKTDDSPECLKQNRRVEILKKN